MSMQSMMSGADCAVITNPLHQVLKHTERDDSLQRDRMAGPSSSRLQHLPPSTANQMSAFDAEMARQFFDANPQMQHSNGIPQLNTGTRFNFSAANTGFMTVDSRPSERWAEGYVPVSAAPMQAQTQNWALDFMPQTQAQPLMQGQDYTPLQSSFNTSSIQRSFFPALQNGHQYGYGSSPYHQRFDPAFASADIKGKGKLSAADYDAAFASFDQHMERSRIVEVDDGVTDLEQAFQQHNIQEVTPQSQAEADQMMGFQRVWDQIQHSPLAPPQGDMAKWEAEYNQLRSEERESYYDGFEEDMEQHYRDLAREDGEWGTKYDTDGVPELGEYVFEPNNPHLHTPSALERAKALLNEPGTSLTEAALLLEAAIQQGDLGIGGYEAWILLGETWSMDEREEPAMRALKTGVSIAEAEGQGEGMISLAISYTNEGYEKASYTLLLRWLRARYPSFTSSGALPTGPLSTWALKDLAMEGYLNVARDQHAKGHVEADVQIGLGVLFYTGGEYEKARDCFESALLVRPNDYLLWNRYGSCLSNGNKPEEALSAYRQALHLRPTYTRAIYNVGVACLNIGAHKEAVEHLLSGLQLQLHSSGGGNGSTSEQFWTTLRRCLVTMDRADLAGKAVAGMDLDMFRREGFEF